jgi:hypothetical protein
LTTQVLDHGFKHAYVVVNCKQNGPRHKESVVPETDLVIDPLPIAAGLGPGLLPGPTRARQSAWQLMRPVVPVPI